jgi:hypothetical protein
MKEKIKKIKVFFKRTLWMLAEKSFLLSLFLILLSFIIGGTIFYKYYILAMREEPQASESSLKLKNQAYEDIINEWEKRQKEFNGADLKNYPDPFWIPPKSGE